MLPSVKAEYFVHQKWVPLDNLETMGPILGMRLVNRDAGDIVAMQSLPVKLIGDGNDIAYAVLYALIEREIKSRYGKHILDIIYPFED